MLHNLYLCTPRNILQTNKTQPTILSFIASQLQLCEVNYSIVRLLKAQILRGY